MSWTNAGYSDEMPSGWQRLHRALVTHVALLRPGVTPFEPRARVVLERDKPSAAARFVTSDRAEPADGGTHTHRGERIVRRGIGQVLGVR
jgi:hypothetical protein